MLEITFSEQKVGNIALAKELRIRRRKKKKKEVNLRGSEFEEKKFLPCQ